MNQPARGLEKRATASIAAYGCSTAAGLGVSALWEGVRAGYDFSAQVSTGDWPKQPLTTPRACRMPEDKRFASGKEKMLQHLRFAWLEAQEKLGDKERIAIAAGRFGVVFASTKGFVDDTIWSARGEKLKNDFLTPILNEFVSENGLHPSQALAVSNACASTMSALWLGQRWIEKDRADVVIVLAADLFGPFVALGFSSLQALTQIRVQPFGKARDGLQLGDAAVAIVLSRLESAAAGAVIVAGTGIDAEGYAVTRPSPLGASVGRAILKASGGSWAAPDLIIAHGTGTMLNDAAEDRVFSDLYGKTRPPITASKWSVGHCLGASGAVDVVLACEALKNQTAFSIANTDNVDPALKANYLVKGLSLPKRELVRVLVTSLGFGGVHAAVVLELGGRP